MTAKNKIVSSVLLAVGLLAAAFYVATDDPANRVVYVNLERPDFRERFIEELKSKKISFRVTESGEIAVQGETSDSLNEKTKDYLEWEAERRREGP